ncbi:hypothetical protein SALWKB2_0603 [Snodgrassella alvi wkB2]|nr:hypothetical protein SALWKB2_0603 [Snodgrassella alvi wkB2]
MKQTERIHLAQAKAARSSLYQSYIIKMHADRKIIRICFVIKTVVIKNSMHKT